MSGPVTDDDLHAYLDGQLAAGRRNEVADWLNEHPVDQLRLQQWREQCEGLHRLFDPVLDEPVPDRLALAPHKIPGRLWPILLRLAACLALLAIGTAGGWWLRGDLAPPQQSRSVASEAFSAHLTFAAEVRHPVEVPASDEAHLVAWLSKRLGTELRVPDLNRSGYALVGGRLLPSATGAAAQFMYENAGGQRVTLYVRANGGGGTTAFQFASRNGLSAFTWLDGPCGYALVGTAGRDQMMALAKAVYRQLNP